MVDEKELPLICRDKAFAKVLSHATQMYEHVIDETGGDEEVMQNSQVTLGADFILDCFDLLLEYALRYEPDFQEIHDDLILMYEEQSKRRAGFGNRTVH